MPFTIAYKNRKCLGINLTKDTQDLYSKKLNKWRDILCLWIRKLNISKMSILNKMIYRFDEILLQISIRLYGEVENLILKLHENIKNLQQPNQNK